MNQKPLVTAVITTYRRELKTVIRAVNSVLNQTYKNIELYVVNDCPEDNKLAINLEDALIKLNDSRIKYICHEKKRRCMCSS